MRIARVTCLKTFEFVEKTERKYVCLAFDLCSIVPSTTSRISNFREFKASFLSRNNRETRYVSSRITHLGRHIFRCLHIAFLKARFSPDLDCLSFHLGQSLIRCPFSPHLKHPTEDELVFLKFLPLKFFL